MRKIGLLSDTHSYIDDKITKLLDSVDEIWHAGDIGSFNVIEKLETIAPVKAVIGNIDNAEMRTTFNKTAKFVVEDVACLITHIGGYPDRYAPGVKTQLVDNNIKLFISGHSHILKVIYDKKLNCLHINPGAAGKNGFHNVRTMVRFTLENGNIKDLEIIELGSRG